MKKKLLALLLCLCLSLAAVFPAAAVDLETAKKLLKNYYVDPIPEEILALDSLEEILKALGDPYTSYMSSQEYDNFLNSVNGDTVTGVGVSIEATFNDGHTIMSILPGSPALDAGLEAGDRVIAVNGTALTPEMDVQRMITGREGTRVTLTVVRQADGSVQDVTMVRRKVDIPIVTYRQIGSAGFIDCISFGGTTAATIQEALEEMDADSSAWVLDLRRNPGGTSQAACESAGLFAGEGTMVLFCDSFGRALAENAASQDMTDKPLIVLTSAYSASASELFSAAVRDYGAGIALGQRTFGKGIAQYILSDENTVGIFDGDSLRITAFRFYSPEGTTNHMIGVLPTLVVSPENAEKAALLLSGRETFVHTGSLKLELAGQTFYVDEDEALEEENRAAFTELLEALPPTAKVYRSERASWKQITPSALAGELRLKDFRARTFSDIAESPFAREIATLAAYQLVSGYEDGSFRPDSAVTRAEFCAMTAAALGLPEGENASFSDVAADDWFAGAVSGMAARGFISGYEDGSFRPENTVTYEEMVTILSGVAAWANLEAGEVAGKEVPAAEQILFEQYSPWAQVPARVLLRLDALVGSQAPGDAGTRETAAGLLCSLMESIGLIWD